MKDIAELTAQYRKQFPYIRPNEEDDWEWFEFPELENLSLHSKFHKNWPYYLKLIKKRFEGFKTFKEWLDLHDYDAP